jgi:hypothetical protein
MSQASGWATGRRVLGALATSAVIAIFGLTVATSTADAAAATPLSCSATVTSHYPKIGTSVGVRVDTLPGVRIRVMAHFRHGTAKQAGRANSGGHKTVWYRLKSDTAPGYRVKVDVTVFRGKRSASCMTWFTPQARHKHGHGGAWCSATATVYNAQYDENNVYVHSNQSYTEATASADGYSWSYETDSTGYALIYLNGPPPGAEITVTVGAATCYTSD